MFTAFDDADCTPGQESDVTDYTARLKVTTPTVNGTSALDIDSDDYITVGTTDGTFTVSVPASVTANITPFNEGYFQLNITPSSGSDDEERLIQGPVICRAENTGA